MKVAVIGDGGWGTALALTLLRNGHARASGVPQQTIWRNRATRRNRKFCGLNCRRRSSGPRAPRPSPAQAVVLVVLEIRARTLEQFAAACRAASSLGGQRRKGFDEVTRERMTKSLPNSGASNPRRALGTEHRAEPPGACRPPSRWPALMPTWRAASRNCSPATPFAFIPRRRAGWNSAAPSECHCWRRASARPRPGNNAKATLIADWPK